MKKSSLSLLLLLSLSTYATTGLLKRGDALYKKREKLENVYEAYNFYKRALGEKKDQASLWRVSMSSYYIGHKLKDTDERMKYFNEGVDAGSQCVQMASVPVECFFWLATNLALQGKEKGLVNLAFGLDDIFEYFEKAKAIDPLYAAAGPYRMLAMLYHKTPGILGGDNNKATELINKAVSLRPSEPLNTYFLMKILVDRDEEDEAVKVGQEFLKQDMPKEFEFFESLRALRRMTFFVENKKWPPKEYGGGS